MFPFFTLNILGMKYLVASSSILFLIVVFAAVLYFTLGSSQKVKSMILVFATVMAAVCGARLFHVLFEIHADLAHLTNAFKQFDGMTFYGALLLGIPIYYILVKWMFDASFSDDLYDKSAIVAAFSYGVLRIACFANGCCWGHITSVPWAVRFYNSPFMPQVGIPVHPVQLYDSVLGFAILALLVRFKTKGLYRGQLLMLFLVMYGVGRFVTEFYRGDSFRGVHVFWFMSTSQVISVALVVLGTAIFKLYSKIGRRREA